MKSKKSYSIANIIYINNFLHDQNYEWFSLSLAIGFEQKIRAILASKIYQKNL
jgi:hypothetical protein